MWRCLSGICDDVVCDEFSCVLCCVRGCMSVVIVLSCVGGQCLQFHLSDLVDACITTPSTKAEFASSRFEHFLATTLQ